MMRKLLLNIMLFCGVAFVCAQEVPEKLPMDHEVRYGILDNGLTYYIRYNSHERKRADFHFALSTGAVIEDDSQNGFTHFLEHMAFNSTQHFKGKSIINYFESIGVNFGSDINVYTSMDEAVYRLSDVPTYREGVIDSALLVMYDWSCGMSLLSEEIDAEREVILEELRTNRGEKRLKDQLNEEMYPDSRYAKRNILGDPDVIKNFKYQSLRDYYSKWYRPDNQAVVVVGDVDVDKVERKIKALWGKIPKSIYFGERPKYSINHNEEPLVVVLSDLGAEGSRILFEYKFDRLPETLQGTAQEYTLNILRELVCNMLDNRLSGIASDRKSSFVRAGCQYGKVVKDKDAFCAVAFPKVGRETDAFNDLYSQLEKMKLSGFTDAEFERARKEKLASMKKYYNERGSRKNITLARECIRNYEDGESMPGVQWESDFVEAVLPLVTLDNVNSLAKSLIHPNPTVAITTRMDKDVDIPSRGEILATITGKSAPKSTQPPLLSVLEGSLAFKDGSNNNIINAAEQCYIEFKIMNSGKGEASGCEARIRLSGATSGIEAHTVKLGKIAPGQSYDVSIPISTNNETKDGKVSFSIEVYEPNGWGVSPFDLTVDTKAYEAPLLKVVDYNIASNSGKIKKIEPFVLTFNLQNIKYGDAEQVNVKVNLPDNIFLLEGSAEYSFPIIKSGETKTIQITLAANNNYSLSDIPITIDVREHYGKYAENKQLSVALNQATSGSITIAAKDEPMQNHREIQLAMMSSDIDRDIPVSSAQNNNTLVLIVANEHYQSMPTVPYAVNDGNVFKEYCVKTLGIPQENVMCQSDVTLNGFRQKVALLQKKAQARAQAGRDTHIIFYYTGHGMPDVNTQSAYLMPIDGFDENVSTGYKLDNLYQLLGQMQAKTVTVFLDACFSGVNRNDKALAVHKGARLTAKSGAPTGNMVIFAASQGNQTASVNDKEKHGLFTYCLLKKLKATEGDISLSDLANYLIGEVNMKSLDLFEKEQIPSVVASPEVENQWQNWKLK